MATPYLLRDMERYGVPSNLQFLQLQDSAIIPPMGVGNPRAPYFPVDTTHIAGNPRQMKKVTADYLNDQTTKQVWLRNHSTKPGLSLSTQNTKPHLISPTQLYKMGMHYNTSHLPFSPVRDAAKYATGVPARAKLTI